MKRVIAIAFLALPIVVLWVLALRLDNYRRDPSVPLGGIRFLPPDQYTDEGQGLLRGVWLLLVLIIPWCVLVVALFGFP